MVNIKPVIPELLSSIVARTKETSKAPFWQQRIVRLRCTRLYLLLDGSLITSRLQSNNLTQHLINRCGESFVELSSLNTSPVANETERANEKLRQHWGIGMQYRPGGYKIKLLVIWVARFLKCYFPRKWNYSGHNLQLYYALGWSDITNLSPRFRVFIQ